MRHACIRADRAGSRFSIAAGLVVAVLAMMPALAFGAPPPGFQNEIVITGLDQPTVIAFTPDGRMLIAEFTGRIWVVRPGATQVEPQPLVQITNINNVGGERGLVGLALDPNFATNGSYYVFYTANTPLRDRVSRFTANGNTTVPGSEVVIWEDYLTSADYHHGGTIAFGPDGYLYISTGDFFTAPEVQSLTSSRGKILRIRSDGTIPTDNPFFDGAGPNYDAIWARGLRNPFRFSFDTVSGRMYIADVGGNVDATSIEEVNIGARGANYGWPTCEGSCGTSGMTNPWFSYPHAGRDASITGGFVYRGTQFPAAYYGNYFYGDYAQNWIRRLSIDSNGNVTGNFNFEPANGLLDQPIGDVVDLKEGPDGALYYVDLGVGWDGSTRPGQVRRIRYTAGNQPPVAAASASPTGGATPLSVAFSSAGSSDPEGQPLTFTWDFGDGGMSSAANPNYVYTRNGRYTARLTVSDGISATLSPPITITAGTPPTATILAPASGTTFRAGDTISFQGSASDADGPAPVMSWTVIFHHDTHTHPFLGPIIGVTSGSFTISTTGHDYSGTTSYEIILVATDSDGLQTSASVFIIPQKVNLTLATAPSGLSVDIDGVSRVTPFVLDTLIGFQHTLNAPNQLQGSTQYTFSSWSDGGAQSHTVITPAVDQSYVATYAGTPSGAGPIAAYGFEDGIGTVAADASGFGNSGVVSNATWTTGRFGGGLAFNGASSRVTAPTVTLGPAFTLMAWTFNPANAAYETIVTVGGTRDLYLGNGIISFWDGNVDRTFGGAVATNSWQHVAIVYDGTALRAYLNGLAQGSAQSVALAAVTATLQIGAWINGATSADFLSGTIDEVRVFNRALPAAEIQSLMAAPVAGPPPPDSAAPVRTSGAPTGTLPAGTTQTTLSLATDENATCRYGSTPGVAYGSIPTTFATTGGTTHSSTVAGLVNGGSYSYYVRCQDVVGNANTTDFTIGFSVASPAGDTTPPVRMNGSPTGTLPAGTTQATLVLATNENATCRYSTTSGIAYGSMPTTFGTTGGTAHSTAVTGLANGGAYSFYVRCQDTAGNANTTDFSISFSVAGGSVSGLVAAYSFNQGAGSSAPDASGNGNTATVSGATWTTAGRFAGALAFNGSGSRVIGPNVALGSAFTLMAWVYNPSRAAYETIVTIGGARDLYLGNGVITLWDGSGDRRFGAAIPNSSWQHVAVVSDGSTVRAYLNGSLRGTPLSLALGPTSSILQIGAWLNGATPTDFFSGTIDEVRVFNRALTQAEIQSLMSTAITP